MDNLVRRMEVIKMEIVKCGRRGCGGFVLWDEEISEFVCEDCRALHK